MLSQTDVAPLAERGWIDWDCIRAMCSAKSWDVLGNTSQEDQEIARELSVFAEDATAGKSLRYQIDQFCAKKE